VKADFIYITTLRISGTKGLIFAL